jgi:hypothetical protein
MSIEVLLNNPDISVIGPPQNIVVQLETGATGDRGSLIFSGFDNPNSASSNLIYVLPNDLFIRASQGQTEGYIYQYLPDGAGGFNWEKIGNLKPSIFSQTVSLNDTAGLSASAGIFNYEIPISVAFNEYSISDITAENVHVSITPQLLNTPIVTTIYNIEVDPITNKIIVIFFAMKYISGSWSAVTESNAKFHITLSLLA